VLRADYSYQGDTYWDPGNISVRSPINLLDMRVGVDVADNWSLMLWAKNLTDERYNTEFSPGPDPTSANFLWPAQPRRWGASFVKQF
jgi:iron complex outermembrane receptor protein